MAGQTISPHTASYRWVVLIAATAAQATASFALLGLAALAGFLQRDFHLDAAETGLLISASYAAPLFSLLFVGDLLDRKSERLIIGIGAAILAAGFLLAVTSRSYAALLAWLFLAGLGYSATQPGGSKSVSAWFRGDRLGLAMGIRQAGLPFGGAVAAAILPAVAAAWSWRAAFVAGAIAALAGGLAFALIYRPPPEHAVAAPKKREALTAAALAQLLRQSWMRDAMVAGLALVSAQYGILTWLMLYLRDHSHIALTRGALFLALAQAAGVAGRIALAAWSDRPGLRFRLLTVSMLAIAAGVLVLLFVPPGTPEFLLALVAAWLGFFGLGWYGPWVAYLAETAPADQIGLTLGAAMALNQLGIIAAPPLLGFVHDLSGGYTALWACVVAALVVAYALTGLTRSATPH